jgi:hypothetical protein
MRYSKLILLFAALLLAPTARLSAQAIVGAWSYGDTASTDSSSTGVFVFLSNGVYFHAESAASDANGQTGMERGTYSWDSVTDIFTLHSIIANSDGQWGLSHDPGPGGSFTFGLSGDTAFDGFLTRVTGGSAIVGAWTYGDFENPTPNGVGVFVFLSNGVYFHAESENSDPNGQNGMERGTYSWDPVTGSFTLHSIIANSNGQWGLSHDPGPGSSFSFEISGDTAFDGFMTRVTAVPEPSTYAAFAGLGALGLALWRRRALS